MLQQALAQGWYLARRCEVRSKANKPVQRLLLSLSKQRQKAANSSLIIHQADGGYSAEYKALLQDFYLKF